jgi:hypothetical protein
MSPPVSPGGKVDEASILQQHPRGTLAIVGVFGLLFGLAWLATYFFVFIGRGVPQR